MSSYIAEISYQVVKIENKFCIWGLIIQEELPRAYYLMKMWNTLYKKKTYFEILVTDLSPVGFFLAHMNGNTPLSRQLGGDCRSRPQNLLS
jgi:hypothetical protein